MEQIKTRETSSLGLLRLAAALSLGAGIVHLMISPDELTIWWAYGFFFIFAGLAQITYSLFLFLLPYLVDEDGHTNIAMERYGQVIYLTGAVGNGAIVALYLVTRTLGVPVGPEAGMVEPATALGMLTTLTELILAGLLVTLARRSEPVPA